MVPQAGQSGAARDGLGRAGSERFEEHLAQTSYTGPQACAKPPTPPKGKRLVCCRRKECPGIPRSQHNTGVRGGCEGTS